jgi:hypothetical protein
MLKHDDIFTVEVTDQMIFDAVSYAEKSLHYTFNRMGSRNLYDRVRNIVKGLIMESAFKRLLDYHNVSYELLGNTHWTKKDRYDVGIDGHKYDIKGFHIAEQLKAKAIQDNPRWLLDCCALVPSDQINARSLKSDDVYVFPFMVGEFERSIGPNLFTIEQFRYLLHCFWDYEWIKNNDWKCKGHIIIDSKLESNLEFRIGGQGENREVIIEKYLIKPGQQVVTKNEFFTVLFIQTNFYPQGEIQVHCAGISKPERISPSDWGNIWVYDSKVYLTGCLTKNEFKQRSIEIPRFYKDCKQYGETKTVNRKMYVHELNPLYSILPEKAEKFISA